MIHQSEGTRRSFGHAIHHQGQRLNVTLFFGSLTLRSQLNSWPRRISSRSPMRAGFDARVSLLRSQLCSSRTFGTLLHKITALSAEPLVLIGVSDIFFFSLSLSLVLRTQQDALHAARSFQKKSVLRSGLRRSPGRQRVRQSARARTASGLSLVQPAQEMTRKGNF